MKSRRAKAKLPGLKPQQIREVLATARELGCRTISYRGLTVEFWADPQTPKDNVPRQESPAAPAPEPTPLKSKIETLLEAIPEHEVPSEEQFMHWSDGFDPKQDKEPNSPGPQEAALSEVKGG